MSNVIEYIDGLERNACQRINRLSHRLWVRNFFAAVSKLGDGWFWVLMGAPLFALQGPAAFPAMLHIATTAGIGVLIYKLLKGRLVRERPYVNHRDILCGAAPLDRYSFPSGHTLHAVSLSVMLAHYEPLLLPVVLPFAILVAASRIVLGLHYPSDVIVGAAIGLALAHLSVAM